MDVSNQFGLSSINDGVALKENHPGAVNEKLQNAWKQIQSEINQLRSRIQELEAEVADRDRRIVKLKTERMNTVSEEEIISADNSQTDDPARAQRVFNLTIARANQYKDLLVNAAIEELDSASNSARVTAEQKAGDRILRQMLNSYRGNCASNHQQIKVSEAFHLALGGQR